MVLNSPGGRKRFDLRISYGSIPPKPFFLARSVSSIAELSVPDKESIGAGADDPRYGAGILFLSQNEAATFPAKIIHSATIDCDVTVVVEVEVGCTE